MKKTKLIFFLIAAFLFLYINSVVAQDNIVFPLTAKSIIQGKGIIFPGAVLIMGDSCAILNPEKHDGPIHSNGYAWIADSGRYVIKFSPPTADHSYPWSYTKVCVGFTGLGGTPTNVPYNIIVYDSTETGPGQLLYCGAIRTAASVPPFPIITWSSSFENIPVTHAVYIGIRIRVATSPYPLIAGDENPATPFWPVYFASTSPPSWQPSSGPVRCLAIRTEGVSATQLLCEGFNSVTFPPTGWTNTNTTLIYRSTSSGFQLGQGSAYFDFWNVVSGTGDLTTLTFTPSIAGDSVKFTLAHCPFGAPDDILLQVSTDGGTTFTTIFDMTSVWMQTTTGCSRPFIPSSAGQWQRRGISLPIGTNKIRFHATSGFGDGAYIDSVCENFYIIGIPNNRNEVPKVYSLSQNYPNPFNPTTKINYELPITNYVKLTIFDILGKEVTVLVNKKQNPGKYEIEWDGTNYSSGIYFYKLTTEKFTEIKRMALIK